MAESGKHDYPMWLTKSACLHESGEQKRWRRKVGGGGGKEKEEEEEEEDRDSERERKSESKMG